jgi:hypothetical protein
MINTRKDDGTGRGLGLQQKNTLHEPKRFFARELLDVQMSALFESVSVSNAPARRKREVRRPYGTDRAKGLV